MELALEASPTFQDRLVPKGTRLVGWAALAHGLRLQAPVRAPSSVAEGYIRGSHRQGASSTGATGPAPPSPTT